MVLAPSEILEERYEDPWAPVPESEPVDLGRLLDLLTPRQREVFEMRAGAAMTAAQVAELLGTTPGAVRVHYTLALEKLRLAVRSPDG